MVTERVHITISEGRVCPRPGSLYISLSDFSSDFKKQVSFSRSPSQHPRESERETKKPPNKMKKLRTIPNLFPSHTKPPAPCFIDESNDEDSSLSPLHQRRGSGRQRREAWSLSSPLTIISKSPSSVCSSTCSGIALPADDVFSRSPSLLWSTGFLLSSIAKTHSTLSRSGSRNEGNASIANEKHNYEEEGEGAKKDESGSRKSESTISTLYESAKNSREMTLEAVRDDETDDDDRDSVMYRPKPYAEFLDEVNRQKIDSQIDSWKKARGDHLQNRLSRKEAKIEEWELRQIQKAKEEMRNYEKLLEEKRARALERMQERIDCVKIEAENRKKHERHSMLAEMSKVEKISEKMHAGKSTTRLKLMSIY